MPSTTPTPRVFQSEAERNNKLAYDRQLATLAANAPSIPKEAGYKRLEKTGVYIALYGLVITLLLIGGFKFTSVEAQGIAGLIKHSPILFWMYRLFSLQTVSNIIGLVEIAIALLLALRPVAPRLAVIGGVGASLTFLTTVSFLLSTPGVIDHHFVLPALSGIGQFLIKDVVLLGAAVFITADALRVAPDSDRP